MNAGEDNLQVIHTWRHCCLDSFKQSWSPHLCERCVCVCLHPSMQVLPKAQGWTSRTSLTGSMLLSTQTQPAGSRHKRRECEMRSTSANHSEMQKILQLWQRLGWGLVCSQEEKLNYSASTQLKSWLILVKGLWNMADTFFKWNTSILLNSKAQTGHPVFKWSTILAERKDLKPGGQIPLNEFAALCKTAC